MFLLPGDSPMGLRLPLDSLLWQPPAEHQIPHPRDPFAPEDALPYGEVWARYARRLGPAPEPPGIHAQTCADGPRGAEDTFVRTALCVEPRNGTLHLFLPPLTHLGHWLALVQAVEQTAAELEQPIVLEGYEAPHDDRLRRFSITPDPGVIEVNVAPEANWPGLVRLTDELYEEARLARLGTEKFMLDGRHVGTGGGNHVTLGGPRPADSPLLRRPHLLGSLVRYWQNHPGLSYLFSGLFVGPTSQAPRVDEARDDTLYELEIALQQLPGGDSPMPWLIDRALRNQLVDLTGNTHRAEFCIDKLYSPDSPTGRRGLVELRAFEMPPHPRMSLVHGTLRRRRSRAATGEGEQSHRQPPPDHLQRPPGSASQHRPPRRVRRRRPLQGLAATVGPAPDDCPPGTTRVRPDRYLERPLPRWLHLSRRAPGRP